MAMAMAMARIFSFYILLLVCLGIGIGPIQCNPNYKDALAKSILFFQGQRSGKLPAAQKITWRSDSGLSDGGLAKVNASIAPHRNLIFWLQDELLWGAAWLFRATNNIYYLNFLKSLGANDASDIFSWDNKYAGARVLLSRRSLVNKDNNFDQFRQQAEDFMCRIIPGSPSSTTQYTPGGLMFKLPESNLQYVTSITFLLTTYSKYMASAKHTFSCGNMLMTSSTLKYLAKKQVDYILGVNPLKMSYMVGFGANYPRRIHHRGSSIKRGSQAIGCDAGFNEFYYSSSPNPNILTGAIVGGPNQNDAYPDERTDYSHSEPATYINAAIVGPLAYFAGSYST